MTIFLVSVAPTTTSQPRTFSNTRFCFVFLSQTLHHNVLGVGISNVRFCLAFLSQTWHHKFLGFCIWGFGSNHTQHLSQNTTFYLYNSLPIFCIIILWLSGFGAKTTCKQMLDTTLDITIIESPSFPSIH
jgi:hypothetical protein